VLAPGLGDASPRPGKNLAGWDQELIRYLDQALANLPETEHEASGDRTELLRALDVPTLVLHGLADTLCDPSGGRATAAAIPGAELVLVEGMGHNIPPGLRDRIADHIASVVRRGEARARLAGGGTVAPNDE
jgi:pimeloyl-ACP methyl ester carboxylesterase